MIKKVGQHSQVEFEYYQIIKKSQNKEPTLEDWQKAKKVAQESLPYDAKSLNLAGRKMKGALNQAKQLAKGLVDKGKSALKGAKVIPVLGDLITGAGIGLDIIRTIKSTWDLLSKMNEIKNSGIKLDQILLPGKMQKVIGKYENDPIALGALGKISVSLGNLTKSIISILGGSVNIAESIIIAPAEVASAGTAAVAEAGINAFIVAITEVVKNKASEGYLKNQQNILNIIDNNIKKLSNSSGPNNQGDAQEPTNQEGITSQAAKAKDKNYKKSKTKKTKSKKVKM